MATAPEVNVGARRGPAFVGISGEIEACFLPYGTRLPEGFGDWGLPRETRAFGLLAPG